MKNSLLPFVLILLTSITLYSCGKKNNNVPTTSDYSSPFLDNLETNSQLRVGQEKSFTQYSLIKQADNTYCDYWEHTTITIKDINDDNVTIQSRISSELLRDNPSSCPNRSVREGDSNDTYSLAEVTNAWRTFIRSKIDANYRCSLIKSCVSGQLVRIEDKTMENGPYRLFVTEYRYSDGEILILESLVSQSSLFEGVIDYILYYKKDNIWLDQRIFNYSSI